MWIYDESGYLIFVSISQNETCRHCGCEYVRHIEACSHSSKVKYDQCPECEHVNNMSTELIFENRKVMAI